jgi:hypothetical protein
MNRNEHEADREKLTISRGHSYIFKKPCFAFQNVSEWPPVAEARHHPVVRIVGLCGCAADATSFRDACNGM